MRRSAMIATLAALASLWAGVASASAVSPGQPDPSFAPGMAPGVSLLGVATAPDGSVVAVGTDGHHGELVRFSTSGMLLSSTQTAGSTARGVAIQSDGKIVVVGGDSTTGEPMFIERFNSNGSVDGGFGSGGVVTAFANEQSQANAVAMQGSEIVVAGSAPITSGGDQGFPGVALLRVSPAGHIDSGAGGGIDLGRFSIANAVVVQSDGKIVIAGSQRNGLQVTDVMAARFMASGGLVPDDLVLKLLDEHER